MWWPGWGMRGNTCKSVIDRRWRSVSCITSPKPQTFEEPLNLLCVSFVPQGVTQLCFCLCTESMTWILRRIRSFLFYIDWKLMTSVAFWLNKCFSVFLVNEWCKYWYLYQLLNSLIQLLCIRNVNLNSNLSLTTNLNLYLQAFLWSFQPNCVVSQNNMHEKSGNAAENLFCHAVRIGLKRVNQNRKHWKWFSKLQTWLSSWKPDRTLLIQKAATVQQPTIHQWIWLNVWTVNKHGVRVFVCVSICNPLYCCRLQKTWCSVTEISWSVIRCPVQEVTFWLLSGEMLHSTLKSTRR